MRIGGRIFDFVLLAGWEVVGGSTYPLIDLAPWSKPVNPSRFRYDIIMSMVQFMLHSG